MQFALLLCLLTLVESAILPMSRPLTGKDPLNSRQAIGTTDTPIVPSKTIPTPSAEIPEGELVPEDLTQKPQKDIEEKTLFEQKTRSKREYDPSKSPFKEVRSSLRWRPNNLQPMGQIFKKYQPQSQ